MLTIKDIVTELESIAPLQLQESYDNAGLITGQLQQKITNILVCLDCIEAIVDEAIRNNCNLIIAHHPIVFNGFKKLNGNNYVERTIIKAIQNNIAIYAIHTNLDSVLSHGVNTKIAEKLRLKNLKILAPKSGMLAKLVTYAPIANANGLRQALFEAGAGRIGNYDSCSFSTNGQGTFRGNEKSNPFVGNKGEIHSENEIRIETIFPIHLKNKIVSALFGAHPYEEVAYDICILDNEWNDAGSGMFGELGEPLAVKDFLELVKNNMKTPVIRHTEFSKSIKKVAICGGSGSFLLKRAIHAGCDAFVTADFKYHEFFDADNKLIICDIGHYESEQFTSELIIEIIKKKFPNFAPILAETNSNPVNYYY